MHVCPLQYSSRTLPAIQSKPGLLADKLSEVQMSYFYLSLCVCQYLWSGHIEKKWGYFHRLGYWEFIIRLILLGFSFVFYINLPIRKPNRMVLSFRFWALFDYWIFPTCHVLIGFVCFCGLSLLNAPWRTVPLLLPLFGSVPTDLA